MITPPKSPYMPRRYPIHAIVAVFCQGVLAILLVIAATSVVAPIHLGNAVAGPQEIWDDLALDDIKKGTYARTIALALMFVFGGATAGRFAWKHTPRSEPFSQLDSTEPRVFYDGDACSTLERRMFAEAGAKAARGLYLAPYLAMPKEAELKNILVVGAPNSGKSHIIRALADQAIERGDRVMLLCNKGDVARSFKPDEAILIGPHHARSHAWDMAADIEGAAGAMQFAADIVPRSNPSFWSDSARLVLSDIIAHTMIRMGRTWTARDIIDAVLADTEVMRRSIGRLDLSASPLLQSSDPDGDDRTVSGIVLTMRSATLANLRPLAWAWDNVPNQSRFSISRWLDGDYKGQKTVILQYSPKLEAVSTLVIGGIMKRVARQLADPETPIDPKRRVFLILDEFDILGRVENFGKALAVGREKGLSVIVGIQTISQMIATYGEQNANVLLDLFQMRIFGRLLPGESTERVSRMLGRRTIRALLQNATPTVGDKRKKIATDTQIATFGSARLGGELGVFKNAKNTGDVHALVHVFGQAFLLQWPFTTWRIRSKGYVPAKWIERINLTEGSDAAA